MKNIKYLKLLSKSFPTISSATTEIINLEAILNLPKGTEHFVTDIHGEYEAFNHVLRNASGAIRSKVNDIFGISLPEAKKSELCTLIYYPKEKLKQKKDSEKDINEWYKVTLIQLLRVCAATASKYTRSKVRKALPKEFAYIIEELLHEALTDPNKQGYVKSIIETIISTGSADQFIVVLCDVICRLAIDSLHIIGDIYDRGPGAHIIMENLCRYHNVDIQWGNHDLLWMGAASGSEACMANVVRVCLRYANLTTLEDGYGVNLMPLVGLALDEYGESDCTVFKPKITAESSVKQKQIRLLAQMHKAIAVIQFKLEGAVIDRNPEYQMEDRKLLHLLDLEKGVIRMNGKEYPLLDSDFPTIDPKDPYKLTEDEQEVVDSLMHSISTSETLKRHMRLFYTHGSLYLVRNGCLMYHGSMPMNADGTFKEMKIHGKKYAGKALFDQIDHLVRRAFLAPANSAEKRRAADFVWYLWCGPDAPPFDKDKMATLERYLVADKELHKETKGHYYTLKNDREICEKILHEFGLDQPEARIINGHIPVKTVKGESPIKADGKLLVIDGGYSKAYQSETGIGGYTLVSNSFGLVLVQHQPFISTAQAIKEELDIISERRVIESNTVRKLVRNTDIGVELQAQIDNLSELLSAYRNGWIKEQG